MSIKIPAQLNRILAIRLDNIGDVVMLSPALQTLRETYPSARITLMASPAGSQVYPLLPWVDDLLTWRSIWQEISLGAGMDPSRERDLVSLLQLCKFDAALIFTSFSQSPYPPAYVCFLAGIPIRASQSREFGGGLLTHWIKPENDTGHQVDRNLYLLEQLGIPVRDRRIRLSISKRVEQNVDEILSRAGILPQSPFMVLAPGASCSARRYPPHRFEEVAETLVSCTQTPMILVGSRGEMSQFKPLLDLTRRNRQVISLIGQTSVQELAGVIARSRLVICNNSAPLHLAEAFERPLVVLYSGTEYLSQWEPRASTAVLLQQKTDCSPCYRFECPTQQECLDIPAENVVEAALHLIYKDRDREFSGRETEVE